MYKKCEEILKELESEGKLKVWWNFKFPEKEPLKTVLKDLLEKEVDEKYYLNNKQFIALKTQICVEDFKDPKCVQIGNLDIKGIDQIKRVYSPEGLSPTLTTMGGGNTEPKIKVIGNYMPSNHNASRVVDVNGLAPTLTTQEEKIITNYRIRKLTPLECWRLMSFDDEDFYKAQSTGNSNSQLYKQAGNSIVVKVLEKIFLNLFN